MAIYQDENANQNIGAHGDLKSSQDSGILGEIQPAGGRTREALKFGPSFQEWSTRRKENRQNDSDACGQRQGNEREFGPIPSCAAAGRESGTFQTSKKHFSTANLAMEPEGENATKLHQKEYVTDLSNSNDTVSSSLTLDCDPSWSQSLRGRSRHKQPWTPRMTVPQGPNLITPDRCLTPARSRSASVRSCTPACDTPASETPRDFWQQSLRGRAQPLCSHRTTSVDNTPNRKKRRSLSHWWAENSSAAKCSSASKSDLQTPGIPLTPEADDTMSESSALHPPPHASPVSVLNGMSKRSKRLSVERKRQEMEHGQTPDSSSRDGSRFSSFRSGTTAMLTGSIGQMDTGSQDWLRSLRQSRSCPPLQQSLLTLALEPNMRTADRARIRAVRAPGELSVGSMSLSQNSTSRQRASIMKHLERSARSLSAKRSTTTSPERRTPSVRPSPGRRAASANTSPERPASSARTSPERRASPTRFVLSATPSERQFGRTRSLSARHLSNDRPSSADRCTFSARESGAVQRHLQRMAASCTSLPQYGSATPELSKTSSFASRSQRRLSSEELAGCPSIVSGFGQRFSKPSASQSDAEQQNHAACEPAARSTASDVQGRSVPECEAEVPKNANPEERAQHARALTQAKFEQARAHERARICVFKRSPRLTTGQRSSAAAPASKLR